MLRRAHEQAPASKSNSYSGKSNSYFGCWEQNHLADRNVQRNQRRTRLCRVARENARGRLARREAESWEDRETRSTGRNLQTNEEIGGICGRTGRENWDL